MRSIQTKYLSRTLFPLFLGCLLLLSGCAEMHFGDSASDSAPPPAQAASSSTAAATGNQPYYPTDFKDLLIPGELTWNRDKSMSIRTASFAGGILQFTGRVEVNSLTDFFVASMTKDGWAMTGSVKQKTNLLVFSKPHKTCMITVSENDFGMKTEVYVYMAEDVSGTSAASSATTVETFR